MCAFSPLLFTASVQSRPPGPPLVLGVFFFFLCLLLFTRSGETLEAKTLFPLIIIFLHNFSAFYGQHSVMEPAPTLALEYFLLSFFFLSIYVCYFSPTLFPLIFWHKYKENIYDSLQD